VVIFLKKQTTIDPFIDTYSQQLRKKVKEILRQKDEQFVDKFFRDYNNSEVCIDNFD